MRHWTDEEQAEFERYVNDGRSMSEIASLMNRAYSTVLDRRQKLRMKKDLESDAQRKMRPCLKCKHDFMSDGPSNRICHRCTINNKIYNDVLAVQW